MLYLPENCVRDGSAILLLFFSKSKRYSGQPDPEGNAQIIITVLNIFLFNGYDRIIIAILLLELIVKFFLLLVF